MKTIFTVTGLVLLLAISAPAQMTDLPYRGDGYLMLNAADLEWKAVASMPPDAQIAVIEGDLSKEAPFIFRLKLPADYSLSPHVHPAYERVTVISGTLYFAHGKEFDPAQTQTLQAGGVAIMPPGAPMFGYTKGETIIQVHGVGPWGIEYVNPEDDPRK